MRSVRSYGGGGGFGGFGVSWDPSSWAVRVTVVTFVVSLLLLGSHWFPLGIQALLVDATTFTPGAVLGGHVWQLVSYVFALEPSPWSLLLGTWVLWSFGLDIERRVGGRAFLVYFFGIAVAAALVTLLLSLPFPAVRGTTYFGASAASFGLLVVWGYLNRGAIVNMFVAQMRAEMVVLLWLGVLVLEAIGGSFLVLIPDFAAFGIAEVVMRSGGDFSPRRAYLRLRAWQIERNLRKRASGFTVIPGGGDKSGGKDRGPDGGYLN